MRNVKILVGLIISILLCSPTAFAGQKLKISGVVVDEQNQPILGADIVQPTF